MIAMAIRQDKLHKHQIECLGTASAFRRSSGLFQKLKKNTNGMACVHGDEMERISTTERKENSQKPSTARKYKSIHIYIYDCMFFNVPTLLYVLHYYMFFNFQILMFQIRSHNMFPSDRFSAPRGRDCFSFSASLRTTSTMVKSWKMITDLMDGLMMKHD